MQGGGGPTEARAALVTGYAEHRASLSEMKKYRRAIKIDLKLPEASTALAYVPRRKQFAEGEEGRQAWRVAFNAKAGEFAFSHVGAETVRNRMGAVGMWGDYCEREGHGKYVEWQRKASGTLKTVVVPVRDAEATGQIKVPDAECIAEYIMVMAIGDTTARPKGGTAAYRSAWHHAQQPKQLHEAARARTWRVRGHADALREHQKDEGGAGAVFRQASAGHGGRAESGDATAREELDESAVVPDGTPAQGRAGQARCSHSCYKNARIRQTACDALSCGEENHVR